MNRGKLIVLTGIDGCGKSTHAGLLAEKLEMSGYTVVKGRTSPRKMPMHKTIQHIRNSLATDGIKFPLDIRAICLAVAMYDYVQSEIVPALENGKIVVLDRYIESTYVYLKGRNIDYRWPTAILNLLPKPDLTLYLNISPDIAASRISIRDELQVHERPEILSEIYKTFMEYNNEHPEIKRIDTNRDMENVHNDILDAALRMLNGEQI